MPNVHKLLERENAGFHTEKSIYHRAHDAFVAADLEVEWKAHHACRHAFITTARRYGAARDWVERITHNASGTIVDHYTHAEWEPLCEVVLKLPWKRRPAEVVRLAAQWRVGDPFGDVLLRRGRNQPDFGAGEGI